MPANPLFKELRTHLAELYPDVADARRVADDAGVTTAPIDFGGKVINMWHAILTEADKHDQVGAIIKIALDEYPRQAELVHLQAVLGGAPAGEGDVEALFGSMGQASATIDTGGGTYITGDVITGGGDFVSRDLYIINNTYAGPDDDKPTDRSNPLRMAYLRWLSQQVDTLFLSQVNPADQAATRLRLQFVYTTQLTQSIVSTQSSPSTANNFEQNGQPHGKQERADEGHRLTAVESMNLHPHLVLLGAPGSGKSSFLKYVALCMAGEILGNEAANLKHLTQPIPVGNSNGEEEVVGLHADRAIHQQWEHGALLPVFITLRDLVAAGLTPQAHMPQAHTVKIEHLLDYVNTSLAWAGLATFMPDLQRELLDQGGLILLDGLDEVPERDELRQRLHTLIEDFCAIYPKCRVLLSSRPYAYRDQPWRIPSFVETTLAPFQSWQISLFIEHYFAHLDAGYPVADPLKSVARINTIKAAIAHNRHLRELAATPLLLTLMMSLFVWRDGVLLERRAELYAQGIDLLLHEWEAPKSMQIGDSKQWTLSVHEWLQAPQARLRQVLEELAFHAHAQQTTVDATARIPTADLVNALLKAAGRSARPALLAEYIQHRAGLLIDQGDGTHTFPHRTIQEYLAACHLATAAGDFPKQLVALVRADPQRWREVLLFAGDLFARHQSYAGWALVDRLCPQPYAQRAVGAAITASDRQMALLAGRLLVETELYQSAAFDQTEAQTLDCVRGWLLHLIDEQQLPTPDLATIGTDLGRLGDPRPGVGLSSLGLPAIDWLEIAAGPFLIGADRFTCSLITAPYRISRYPITVAQYGSFIEAGGYAEPRYWTAAGWAWRQQAAIQAPAPCFDPIQAPNHPQTGVSWYEAVAFCTWLTAVSGEVYRLPSEAEWERAARHTDGRTYPWGNDFDPNRCNMRDDGVAQPTAVGIFPKGRAHCGAADMAGNVWEWCATPWQKSYNNYAELVDNTLNGNERRVLRGGSWANERRLMRAANRHRNHPNHRGPNVGFRVVS